MKTIILPPPPPKKEVYRVSQCPSNFQELLHRTNNPELTRIQNTLNSHSTPKQKHQCWCHYSTWSPTILQSHSKKKWNGTDERNRKKRTQKRIHSHSYLNFGQNIYKKKHIMEKREPLQHMVPRHPCVKEWN